MVTRCESILIVDDEHIVRRSLSAILSREGYHCEEADGAEKALQRLESTAFDLTILDIRMPGKSGLELLPELKDRYPDMAVIMFTAVKDVDAAVNSMKDGAIDYITKPFNLNGILHTVKEALQRRNEELQIRNNQRSLEQSLRAELQRENEQKTKFLHSVAHEIKTPLTAIIASSELLSEAVSSPDADQKIRIVGNIARSARSMNERLTRLIHYSQIQGGTIELKTKTIELDALIRQTVSSYLPIFASRDQKLCLDMEGPIPKLEADQGKVEEILANLLYNANNYSHRGGTITLHVKAVDSKVVVMVEDSAPSITEEEKRRLFEPYYRGKDADRINRIPGLGLGLTIARKLVELHGGEMWLEPRKGEGNIFAFSLPLTAGRC
jgi:signal transduction histidine kinase